MANIGSAAALAMLDWSLGRATNLGSLGGGAFIGLSVAAPSSAASSEVPTGLGYVRTAMTFANAAAAAGSASASNSTAATFGAFNAATVVSGIFVSNTVSSGAGSMQWYGTLAAARSPSSGDQLVLAAGALAITLG